MAPTEAEKRDGKVFPLAYAATGERVRIAALAAGKGLERRLIDLGLPVGSEIEVMHRQGAGRLVVGRGPARMALGAGMSHMIMVRLAFDPAGAARTAVPLS